MIIENAFHYLPEILCGSNYAAQKYEAGIVNAVSLAVLQELNARNVPNPLAALTVEKLYSEDGFDRPDELAKRRYLRADLFVDTTRTFLGTAALSRFGWRHQNYLEAKFFRPDKAPSTLNAADLLGDLIRLCCMVPPRVHGWNNPRHPKPSPCDGSPAADGRYADICVGRYLLHVYEGDPEQLLGKTVRPWTKEMRQPGDKQISIKIGDDGAETFKRTISKELGELGLTVSITNRVIGQREKLGKTSYLCVLTRINSFTATFGDLSWSEGDDRRGTESSPGAWAKLQAIVGKHLLFSGKVTEETEDMPPSDMEFEIDELSQDPEWVYLDLPF